jgi:hypothetical protein
VASDRRWMPTIARHSRQTLLDVRLLTRRAPIKFSARSLAPQLASLDPKLHNHEIQVHMAPDLRLQSRCRANPGNQKVCQNQSGRIEVSRSTIIMISIATAVPLIGAAASAIAVRSEPVSMAASSSYEVRHQTAPMTTPRGHAPNDDARGATDGTVYSSRRSSIRHQL